MTDCETIEGFEYEDFGESKTNDDSFVIVSDLQAEWILKKIKRASEEYDRLVNLATEEIESLTKQIDSLHEKYKNETGFFKMKLFEYFSKVQHKETKTQESYKLLSGNLVWKKPTQKMVPDKEKLLAYVEENSMPEFVKVKKEIDWAAYKKECEILDGKVVNTQTGDLLPDDVIAVEDVPGEFDIKL